MSADEQDLRGEVALTLMALMSWAEMFRGGCRMLLDGSVAAWLEAGRPSDPQFARALTNTRRALARYVAHGGQVPVWVPASLLSLLKEQRTDTESAATAPAPPSENTATTTSPRRHSVAKVPKDQPNTKGNTP
jgi:hypothetical protein